MLDPWQHVGSVLCNLTRFDDGRRILLRQSSGYMPKLVTQVSMMNVYQCVYDDVRTFTNKEKYSTLTITFDVQIRSQNVVRRRGAVGSLRRFLYNCLYLFLAE